MRTILCHVNVEVPEDSGVTAGQVEGEVKGALEVAAEGGHCPALATADVAIALTEEV